MVLQSSKKQGSFKKGVSEAILSSLLLLNGELLARWTLLNLHSSEMKKYSVNLLPNLADESDNKELKASKVS